MRRCILNYGLDIVLFLVCFHYYIANGQLGDSTTTNNVSPGVVPNIADVTQISVADTFTCALVSNGSVSCWGANTNGIAGVGVTTANRYPQYFAQLSNGTTLTNVVKIVTRNVHICALTSESNVYCWGGNSYV